MERRPQRFSSMRQQGYHLSTPRCLLFGTVRDRRIGRYTLRHLFLMAANISFGLRVIYPRNDRGILVSPSPMGQPLRPASHHRPQLIHPFKPPSSLTASSPRPVSSAHYGSSHFPSIQVQNPGNLSAHAAVDITLVPAGGQIVATATRAGMVLPEHGRAPGLTGCDVSAA